MFFVDARIVRSRVHSLQIGVFAMYPTLPLEPASVVQLVTALFTVFTSLFACMFCLRG